MSRRNPFGLRGRPGVRKRRADLLKIEAEPRPRAVAEPDGAELGGARVDPVTFDAERACQRGGVDVAPGSDALPEQQFDHTRSDRFDVVGVETHDGQRLRRFTSPAAGERRSSPESACLGSRVWS
ncbi:hypothetical protein DVA67_020605 [Solirubrobacter sp. CPCC 204708]|nr:hypothetical protein [Solirubrobacter deserti]